MSKLTLVTGLWNIKRDELGEGWSRSFEHYLEKFDQLLKVDNNMIIFGDSSLEEFVFQRRSKDNTLFISRSTDWFKNEFFDKIQKIRTDENWYSQSGWLSESTQARLEMYNPLVMSKVFLLHDAKIFDPFDSEHMFWIDAGLTNTVHQGYFTHDKVLDKLPKYINKFSFVCFPYEANNEIHGFKFSEINNIAGTKVELVGRGGFFGGPKNTISDINSIYYNILQSTLSQDLMGTEESIFSIMVYKHADMVDYFEIESNGLFGKFFEDLKNDSLVRKNKENLLSPSDDLDVNNAALYVITFNSPKQFETLIESMNQYDSNFLSKPKKFLLDNSSDLTTTDRYKELCEQHGFEHIKKDNLGICGGRQFIAEHADENNFDFYQLEKSIDANQFTTVATIKGKSINGNAADYSFTDASIVKDKQYYRLKMVNRDGSFNYSQVITSSSKSTLDISLYPNPVNKLLIVTHPQLSEIGTLQIFNQEGKLVQQALLINNDKTLNVSELAKGLYTIVLEFDNKKIIQKLIKNPSFTPSNKEYLNVGLPLSQPKVW